MDNARKYAEWIASRYRNEPNIIWTMYPQAKQEFVPIVRELAKGLIEGDKGRHMITVHPDPIPASSSFIKPAGSPNPSSIRSPGIRKTLKRSVFSTTFYAFNHNSYWKPSKAS